MRKKKITNYWIYLGIIIVIAFLFFAISSAESGLKEGNTAVIPIHGEISTGNLGGFIDGKGVKSSDIVRLIQQAQEDTNIKAILLDIDSPGGAPVASEEIVNAVKRADKLVVALIRENGASGAYWVASAADYIIASPFSLTGSIGVLGSYLEFSGLLDKYGVSYTQLTSGEHKDIAAPFKKLTGQERALMQKKLDLIHRRFLDDIRKSRNLSAAQYKEISTGIFYLGEEAVELNLVDALGDKQTAISYISEQLKIDVVEVPYNVRKGFFESLSELSRKNSFFLGFGIGTALYGKERLLYEKERLNIRI